MGNARAFLFTMASSTALMLAGCSSDSSEPDVDRTDGEQTSDSAATLGSGGDDNFGLVLEDKCADLVGVDLAAVTGQIPTLARSGLECEVFAGTDSQAKLTFILWDAEGPRGYEEALAEFGPGTPVPDVGDQAFDAGSHLFVQWDDKLVDMLIGSQDPEAVIATDTMVEAARIIMANSDA
jgi:hypothetical protein